MKKTDTTYSRRSFLKVSSLSGGGLMLGISWLASAKPEATLAALNIEPTWQELTSYIKITPENVIKIFSPNPEFGQNVMTSLPMLIAEELDVDFKSIVVEQASYNPALFSRQFTGGSQSIRSAWKLLRTAGASARQMILTAASQAWNVPVSELTTSKGRVKHAASGKSASYGSFSTAASKLPVPKDIVLKANKGFRLLGTPQKNVEGPKIVHGQPLFGMDYKEAGMLIAMTERPPAFGMRLKSFDATAAKKMPGIVDVFTIQVYEPTQKLAMFDTRSFNEVIAVVGKTTWDVMNARKKLNVVWENAPDTKEIMNNRETIVPAGLESTSKHYADMLAMDKKPGRVERKDGEPEKAFEAAKHVIERTYTAPFLAHNIMEPTNTFAHFQGNKVRFVAPIQGPDFIANTIAMRLGIPKENIEIQLARMGGGFGRRAYGHYMVEAALISKQANAPIKLVYSREDDVSGGIYRPTYQLTYRAAFDENKRLTAMHIKGGGIPESPLHANRFPAGALDNYLAESWFIPSNITVGAFRAPRSNFNAAAEQSFLDEVSEYMGKDPIAFRLELLQRAKDNPVGKNNDYDASRYMGVLELVRDKSGWGKPENANKKRGVSAYFCHNSYAAQVIDLRVKDGQVIVDHVTSAVDCGVVVNPEGAKNMAEGAAIDGIGNALFGNLSFTDGRTDQKNFDTYRMIRHNEAPKKIDVHFVANETDPTGLGEPPFPPIFGAMANALYKATGKRLYKQPFGNQIG
ncbi:xanthine dehydrogenase family protein molybdopterin-binding subunit [Cytophagaceae bacterium 50C-KIRBA]|uniref:Xanthine dehydrogenase family protein molybdopterin-binding subunit n=1 Tax=Aquirufa beregesia TaxID=2516556 RepID=A0ABX0F1A2_9BACT|nr:molybdopterin cofactor-binding domain-containing protein [Aquirufa beregesia]NGZ43620.1 xanthine dehydrogenase family protein molybdopterin-binding subunit [Aquirufa beregesia]